MLPQFREDPKYLLMHRLLMGRSLLLRYGLALLSVAVAIAIRHALYLILGGSGPPFATVAVAVMLTAWVAGTGPAVVAAIVGLVAGDWYFLAPAHAFQSYVNIVQVAKYLVLSGATLLLSAAYQRSASRYAAELRRREAIGRELLQERDALREAEEKFRAVAEIATTAIFIHDGRRLRYLNRASEEILGYTRDELLKGDTFQLVHSDYREQLRERSAARFRGERMTDHYEFKIVTKSGEERWLDIGSRLISFDGKPCILGNAFDVTDRKRTEEALRNREEYYRLAIEAAKVGTWEWDIAQNKVIFSDRIYEYTGIEKTARYVTYERWMEPIHPDDRPRVAAALQSAVELDAKYEAEFRVVQQGTNDVRWVVSTGRVLRDNAGKPLRMLGAAVDVTERRRSEEALRNSEKLAAAGRLAASIAHEINNPLEAVTNLIFLARTAGAPNLEGEGFLAMAEEELKRAAHLTKQTLGFYRDSSSPTCFNVAKVIDDVLSLYAGRIEAKRVQVKKRYLELAEMKGMVGEIRQAISNLIANALDAMLNSGGILDIRVRRTRHSQRGSAVRITVADTGMGIAAEHKKRIFEPFFTTKQETGTGLGLWLTKNIVEKHRGTIRVSSSNTGRSGTVFVLTFPSGDFHPVSSTFAA
jgi:PAS domain S-box-containing protein